ncbi:SusC/RagA family TonB-linked outer membrane protein [Fodinibius sediminis]|uniref:TonB-linked outer membrane protein, SusC/RagA family n=1 Tax=Fodinibius sediminis TaxID=1214077 RepID=A0A521DMR5_9BACT|nr:TonB-dependent receptor [Fodinibius sediminis]SMO72892.1 TonB-linked outer membrane protein, SusC/RagA family [Fodinibius sediminis]
MKKLRWIMMGLIVLFVMRGALAQGSSSSDDEKIMLTSSDINGIEQDKKGKVLLSDFLLTLENHFDVTFLYKDQVMMDKYVQKDFIRIDEKTGQELSEILKQLGITFQRIDKQTYVLLAKTKPEQPEKNQEDIGGTVTDAQSGETLPGVNILVKGTSTGASTDANGEFELTVPSLQDTLIVTYIGYQKQEVPINGQDELDIQLSPQAIMGEEMVIVGYGEARAENITGSIETLDVEQIDSRPATNVSSLLQGQIPGVNVTQATGLPGQEEASILIRGLGTMNDSQPMVVVDGIESSIDNVNPNDIASISVLKDAASAAIYGTRAANGVILITTKRGREGSPQISYKTYGGWQQPTGTPDFLESADYARLLNEANENEGISPRYTEEEIRLFETGEEPFNYPNVDWYNSLLKSSAFTQDHNLRVSGGNKASTYSISLGYNDQNGLLANTKNERYNMRANLDSQVNDWLDVGLNLSFAENHNTMPTAPYAGGGIGTFFAQMARIPPTTLDKFEDGTWARHIDGNPKAWLKEGGTDSRKTEEILGTFFLEADLSKSISFEGSLAIDYSTFDRKRQIYDFEYGDGTYQGPNSLEEFLNRDRDYDSQAIINFNTGFNSHSISGLLGTSYRNETTKYTSAYRRNLPSNRLSALNAGSTEGMSNNGYDSETKLSSFFGRVNYDFDSKYFIESNLRIDGSSKFAPDNRWGIFPSVSAGWLINKENFMQDIEWINFLRLRASWGRLGNHRISNYQYLPLISLGQNYPFGGAIQSGAAQLIADNPDISWEVTTETNLGVDMEFFQSQLAVSLNYYDRFTDDILTNVPVSEVFGLPAPIVNAGAMSNKGIEIELEHFSSVDDFQYDISFNTSFNRNVVENYDNPSVGDTFIRVEGEPWNSFYGYEWIGYFMSDEEAENSPVHHPNVGAGDLKFKDQNGDGEINADDRVVLGNTIPEITFGLNLGLNYKSVDFSAFFQGADRVNKRLGQGWGGQWPFQNAGKAQSMHLDRMIVEDGQVVEEGYFPRTLVDNHHNEDPLSSFQVHDAAYVRLKNLQLGYTLPVSWTEGINISNVRFYFSGQNLLTFTRDFPGNFDPEAADGRSAYYPQVEIYTFGMEIDF